MIFDIEAVRRQFPALAFMDNGRPRVYLDNPAGTQVPVQVLDRMQNYLIRTNANQGGNFITSHDSDRILTGAHQAMADLLNAKSSSEIIFGANMTTLTYAVSRSLGRRFRGGGTLLLTRMDHDGNVAPWLQLAEDLGLSVRWLEFDLGSYEYQLDDLESLLAPGDVCLAAVNYASNCLGTINDVKSISRLVKEAGGLVYVDAVQYVPHGITDVQDLGCDFLVCSPYKFFGPHQGVLWGRYELLDEMEAYKVRPASDIPPGKFESGTQAHESQAGTLGAVEYFEWIGTLTNRVKDSLTPGNISRRENLTAAFKSLISYEQEICKQLIGGLQSIRQVKVHGITDPLKIDRRVPTVSFTVDGLSPQELARNFARENIFVWSGHNYALETVRKLGLKEDGGVLRVGPVHYNTAAEIELFLGRLEQQL